VVHQPTLGPVIDAVCAPGAAGPGGRAGALEQSLAETTFVVVDLETTGGAPDGAGITEIGAVKVRGGEVLGEFATLVNPGERIPPYIVVLTGITDAMLAPAPKLDTVLPSFIEFAAGAVMVAHNAPYDTGFLKGACAKLGYPWPKPVVLDTVTLARRTLLAGEVPNRKLATLAKYFGAASQPSHRALDDARATVDVLHALIARLGGFGVHTLGDALEFVRAVSPAQRGKRRLADGLPDAPVVYVFRDRADRPLYIGTSTSIATRVRSYFTAAERRARIDEMITAAERVEAIECAHALEAEVRELRLIAAAKPPYNRRSKYPERVVWLKLTAEAYPRLSIVRRTTDDGAAYLGPFGSRHTAEQAAAAVHEALRLRQCTTRLSTRTRSPACALAELGRCAAPCEHAVTPADYVASAADPFRTATTGDPGPILRTLLARIDLLAGERRYEDAAVVRERMVALLRATVRMQRLASLTVIEELSAARPTDNGGWEIAVVRRGRLAAAAFAPRSVHPVATLDRALATAETVLPGIGPTPAASAAETERILAWLERPETRLVRVTSGWSTPAGGAERWRPLLALAEQATREGSADRS
jgi:DNA polymerase-3 subunit epsilon